MRLDYSFRFVDDMINDIFIKNIKKSKIKHSIDKDGVIHYSSSDEETVGNELLRSVRDTVFPTWQIISCPEDWTEIYRNHMNQNRVPFIEELIDHQLCFLIPRKFRPHRWKLRKGEGSDFE